MSPLDTLIEPCRWWIEVLAAQSTSALIVALVACAGLRLFRVSAPAAVEAAWWLVLARLAVPPAWASPWSVRRLWDAAIGWMLGPMPAAWSGDRVAAVDPQPIALSMVSSVSRSWWPVWGAVLWIVGASVVLVVLARRTAHYRRTLYAGCEPANPRARALVSRWRRLLRVRRRVRIVVSDRCLAPFTNGVWRPSIHLPTVVAGWQDELLEPVVAHEVAHIARWDTLRIGLVNAFRAVFFFHPLVWLAAGRLATARERACDDLVLARGAVSPRSYGHSLMAVLRLNMFGTARADGVLGLAGQTKGVEMRLHAIRDHRFTRRPPAALVATACVLAGAILLPMSGVRGTEVMAEPTADGIAEPAVPPAQQAAAESAEKILRYVVDGDMTAPHPIKRVNPRYTEEARLERIQGGVVLETVIDRDGTVTDIKVLRGLPLGLSEAAVEAVREWRFEPSILDGEPAAVRYILTIRFSLDDEEGRRSTALVPSFDHSSPAVTLHFGDRETFPEDTVDRLSRIVDRVRLELPVGVRLTDAGMQGATLGLSGIAGPDGVETSVATFVQRLALLPEIRAVDLKDLRHGDGGLYRFVVEAELDE